MSGFELQVLSIGLSLGLASSLHCLAMCSGLAGTLAMAGTRRQGAARIVASSLILNAGRVFSYVAVGGVLGAIGSTVLIKIDMTDLLLVVRWAGIVTLSWIGLTIAGLLPVPRFLYALGYPIHRALSDLRRRLALPWIGEMFLAGIAWGFLPCSMVYAALFYAAFAGSWSGGALAMLGYGIGTSAPLLAAAAGIPGLGRSALAQRHPKTFGLGLMAASLVGIAVPAGTAAILCLGP